MNKIIYLQSPVLIVFFGLLFLPFSLLLKAQQPVPYFEGTLREVFEAAKTNKRLVFIDVYKNPCPNCMVLDNYLENGVIVNELVRNYVCYKMDGEAFGSIDFFDKINVIVRAYPTILIINPNTGEVLDIKREVGSQQSILDFLKRNYDDITIIQPPPPVPAAPPIRYSSSSKYQVNARFEKNLQENYVPFSQNNNRSSNDEGNLNALQKEYEMGNRGDKFLMEYIKALQKNKRPFGLPMKELVEDKGIEDVSTEFIQFIYDFSTGVETDALRFFVKNRLFYKEKYGYMEVNEKLKAAIESSTENAIKEPDGQLLFERCMEVIDYIEIEKKHFFKFKIQSRYYTGKNMWNKYTDICKEYIEERHVSDPGLLNEVANNYKKYVTDKRKLNDALRWIDESVKYASEYENNLTYAQLAFNMGKYDIAKFRVMVAIEIAKTRGINHIEADKLYDDLKQY